jgi:monoamine oxidase
VVVIGAGFARLMAAWTPAGKAEVRLFEARERVGGRVRNLVDDISKRIIEAGAELIGYAHPTWLTLARHF